MAPVQIVWFKRDIRVADHAPLAEAAARGPVLPLFVAEPSLLRAPDADPRHWSFVAAGLSELRERLAALGQPLVVRTGEVVPTLDALRETAEIGGIWAHEETGNRLSYARDRAVRAWARQHGIPFRELPKDGVVRRLPTRDAWAGRWEERMRRPPVPAPDRLQPVPGIAPGPIPTGADLRLEPDRCTGAQPGGEAHAHATLASFLEERGTGYTRAMSSPLTAEAACSRISPYLAWGNLSVRQAVHAMRARIAEVRALPPTERGSWLRDLSSFDARLHWRDHFIQKLEDEPEIEGRNFVRAYDGMREGTFDLERFEAWAAGRTGYPLVDACMRALDATGWINFRMRAMLVSFASFDLWLHWREPGLHLARLFLDYEPGIHWSQHQMQAGTTGINTVRVYNPTKQAQEQDPEGVFIRRWLPELAAVPTSFVHLPWLMPRPMQEAAGCLIGRDYPAPVVDHDMAAREAQRRIHDIRSRPETKAQADAVQAKHGSRRRPTTPGCKPAPQPKRNPGQLSLGLD